MTPEQYIHLRTAVGHMLDIVNVLAYQHMETEFVPVKVKEKMAKDLELAKVNFINSVFTPIGRS